MLKLLQETMPCLPSLNGGVVLTLDRIKQHLSAFLDTFQKLELKGQLKQWPQALERGSF